MYRFLFILIFSFSTFSQDLSLSIRKSSIQKNLNKIIQKTFKTDNGVSLFKDSVILSLDKVEIKTKNSSKPNNALLVYGNHLLNLDFSQGKKFKVEIELQGLKVDINDISLNLNLENSSTINDKILIPFNADLKLIDADILIDRVGIIDEKLTEQNRDNQESLIDEVLTWSDNGLLSEKMLNPASKEKIEDAMKAIQLKECRKKINNNALGVTSENHSGKISDLDLKISGEVLIFKDNGELRFQIRGVSVEHNLLNAKEVAERINLEINLNEFQTKNIGIITYENGKVICHELEDSESAIDSLLPELIAKIQTVIGEKLPEALSNKIIPLVEQKINSINGSIFDHYKLEINESLLGEHTDLFCNYFADSAKNFFLDFNFSNLYISQNYINLSIDQSLDSNCIDECFQRNEINYQNHRSDLRLTYDLQSASEIIHKFDDYLLANTIEKIDLLKDHEGEPILGLENKNISIISNGEINKFDVLLNFELDREKMGKLLRVLVYQGGWFQEQVRSLKSVTCQQLKKRGWIYMYLLSKCFSKADKRIKHELVKFSIEVEIEKIHIDGHHSFKINLPSAGDLFESKHTNKENFQDFPILNEIKSILMASPDKFLQDKILKKLFKEKIDNLPAINFYRKVLPRLSSEIMTFGPRPFLMVPIDYKKISKKLPFDIIDLNFSKSGEVSVDLNFKAPSRFLSIPKEVRL